MQTRLELPMQSKEFSHSCFIVFYYNNLKLKGDIMHIPNIIHFRTNIFVKEEPKKHIVKLPETKYEKGDPDFIDERTKCELPKREKSFLSSLFE